MIIQKITTHQLLLNFFSTVTDIVMDDPSMVRHHIDHEIKAFSISDVPKIIRFVEEEPYMYAIGEDVDVLIISVDDEYLCTVEGNKMQF